MIKNILKYILLILLFSSTAHAIDYTWSVGTATGSAGSNTLSVTNGSATMTTSSGFNTDYTGATAAPQAVSVGGTMATIISIDSDASATLSLAWSDSTQSGLSHTIGSRDFAYAENCVSTQNAALVTTSDSVRCEMYADQTYAGTDTYEGGNDMTFNTTPTSTTLTAHSSARHNGTEGSGVLFQSNTIRVTNDDPGEISWIEWDGTNRSTDCFCTLFDLNNNNAVTISHNIIHDWGLKNGNYIIWGRGNNIVHNNLVYSIDCSDGGSGSCGFYSWNVAGSPQIYNNTIHDINKPSASTGISFGINAGGSADCQNNIVTDIDNAGTGTPITIAGCSTDTTNATSDGAGNSITVGDTDQYTDGVGPTYDLSILNSGVAIVDAGTDLESGGPTDIDLDIESTDRTGLTWDIGAFEDFEAAAATPGNTTIRGVTMRGTTIR